VGRAHGLLPRNERCFTIYFAQLPLARFDSAQLRTMPLPDNRGFDIPQNHGGAQSVRDVPGLTGLKCQAPPAVHTVKTRNRLCSWFSTGYWQLATGY
jgi:hypothetical protein